MSKIAYNPLPEQLRPSEITIDLGDAVGALERAHEELILKADQDDNGCFGFFPALAGSEGISIDLPACINFAATVPRIAVGGMTLAFNFLRLSNRKQGDNSVFHIDTDAATALTGDISTINERLVRRSLLNLSHDFARTVAYLDIHPEDVELDAHGSYLGLRDPRAYSDHEIKIIVPSRQGSVVSGFDFFSNRVLHSGRDDEAGHFVAGYGCEIHL